MYCEGCYITESKDLKECIWCGGKFDKTNDYFQSKKRNLCSYECNAASEYFRNLLGGFGLISGGIFLLVCHFTIPEISENLGGLLGAFILIVGFLMMWISRDGNRARKETPQNSRMGQFVGESGK